jgi:hypothetical protein
MMDGWMDVVEFYNTQVKFIASSAGASRFEPKREKDELQKKENLFSEY